MRESVSPSLQMCHNCTFHMFLALNDIDYQNSVARIHTCSVYVSQKADQVVWYSHVLKNFPQLIVIHTVKGFGIVNKAEIDVFLELSCFFHDPAEVENLTLVPLPFLKPA